MSKSLGSVDPSMSEEQQLRELGRLRRELDLVKSRSEVKISALEEVVAKSNTTISQLRSDLDNAIAAKQRMESEMQVLLDSIVDQANEMSSLRNRQRCMDQEMARKDKDAQELVAVVRRYKSKMEYLKNRVKRGSVAGSYNSQRRSSTKSAMGGDDNDTNSGSVFGRNNLAGDGSTLNGSIYEAPGDQSPAAFSGAGYYPSSGRKDSIPFPGYMTSEEEYFRLVLMAAKLNATATFFRNGEVIDEIVDFSHGNSNGMDSVATPSFETPPLCYSVNEVNEADFNPKSMYEKMLTEQVPFHKWHEWATAYVVSHHMPPLIGVEDGESLRRNLASRLRKKNRNSFANKIAAQGKQIFGKIIPKKSKRTAPVGIATGGDETVYYRQ